MKETHVAPVPETEEQTQDWIFTFGCGQVHAGHYTVIHGTFHSSRERMFELYGQKWSMQYPSKEAAGVEEYHLKELK